MHLLPASNRKKEENEGEEEDTKTMFRVWEE